MEERRESAPRIPDLSLGAAAVPFRRTRRGRHQPPAKAAPPASSARSRRARASRARERARMGPTADRHCEQLGDLAVIDARSLREHGHELS
jgi:hypothetical protein